ncbi:fcf2 [Symbiodinium sp. KB8]|nr:fcf2 [Symbiodinium sp. KB8]
MALPEGADEGAWAVAAGRAAAALAPETFDTELTAARAGTFTHTVLARAPGLKADLAPYLAFHTDGSVAARPSGVWRGASRGTKRARSDAPAVVGDVDVSQGAAAAAQSAVLAHGAVAARPTAAPAVITKAHRKAARGAAPDTAGKGWFNLAAPEMTAQVKADLEVLKNRRALEGWAEGVPGRMTRKERQGSLLGEVAADARLAAYAKRKYGEHQDAAAKRGKGAAFKRTQARRSSWRRK